MRILEGKYCGERGGGGGGIPIKSAVSQSKIVVKQLRNMTQESGIPRGAQLLVCNRRGDADETAGYGGEKDNNLATYTRIGINCCFFLRVGSYKV